MKQADTKYKKLRNAFGEIDEVADDMLKRYCYISAQIDELDAIVEKQGMFIGEEGKLKENPAIHTKHKLMTDLARCATFLRRILKEQGDFQAEEQIESWYV